MDLGKTGAPLFDCSAPEYRRKLWVRLAAPNGVVRVVVFWRRIAAGLLALAVAGWLSAAAAVYVFVRVRHDFAGVSYLNLVWPPRWPLHRQALGRHYITRGQQALALGDYTDAAQSFAAGVARVPDDIPARRQLAILYIRFGELQAGLKLLSDGLTVAHDDLEYLKLTFGLLDELQEDARILELAQEYLPAKPDELLPHQFIALQAATACYHRGNYDAAEKTVADWRLDRSLEGQLLLARCDWERGYPRLAVLRLEQQRERFSDRDELSLELIRFYRELGRNEEALNEALVRHSADPFSPGPRIDLLYSWLKEGDLARVTRETDAYLHDFASDPAALTLLGWFAADNNDAALTARLLANARSHGLPLEAFALSHVQALLGQDRYKEALAAAEAALVPHKQNDGFVSVLAGLRALACFGAGDPSNGEIYLQAFLVRQHLRANDALLLARRLDALGAPPQARRVLVTAVRTDPFNQAVLTELVRQETTAGELAALEEYLPPLLAMRKPDRAVLQEAYLKLDDATPARAALRVALKSALEKSPTTPEPAS